MSRSHCRFVQIVGAAFFVAALLAVAGDPQSTRPAAAQQSIILYGASSLNPDDDDGQGISALYRIDPATGESTLVGSLGYRGVSAMDFHPDNGKLYAVGRRVSNDEAFLLTINPRTARATEIGPINNEDFQRVPDMSFRHSDNALFAWDENVDRLARIDIATGTMTTFGQEIDCAGHGMAFSKSDVLYLADCEDFYRLNQTTGAGTFIDVLAPLPPDMAGASALESHPVTGELFAAISSLDNTVPERFLATVDPGTAELDIIGPSVEGLDALAFQIVSDDDDEDDERRPPALGGLAGALTSVDTAQRNRERANAAGRAAAAAAAAQTAPPVSAVRPPSTGDAGLADFHDGSGIQPWIVIVAAAGMVGAAASVMRRRRS